MLAVRAGVWISTLTAVLIVSLISLVGTLVLVARETFLRRILHLLIGLAVGALLGDALIHILPELAEEGGLTTGISLTVVGSILFFFLAGKVHPHAPPASVAGTGTYQACRAEQPDWRRNPQLCGRSDHRRQLPRGARLGLATTIAVVLHEIPQEIGDLGVLVHAGLAPRRAVLFNLAVAMTALIGGVLTLSVEGSVGGIERPLLATSAGAFIYIAGADLIPEMHDQTSLGTSVLQFVGVTGGFAAMAALLVFE
jgi:zinc and cadmium transporter